MASVSGCDHILFRFRDAFARWRGPLGCFTCEVVQALDASPALPSQRGRRAFRKLYRSHHRNRLEPPGGALYRRRHVAHHLRFLCHRGRRRAHRSQARLSWPGFFCSITLLVQLGLNLAPAGQPKRNAMPKRVQLQRGKGWRMPPNTRKVDRSTVFGNPFDSVKYGVDDAIRMHRAWFTGAITDEQLGARYPALVAKHLIARRRRVLASLHQLHGMNLACWCSPSQACHADLLLELANRPLAHGMAERHAAVAGLG